MRNLFRPGLIVAVFVPIGGSAADAAAAREYLAHLWAATETLGMDEPLLDGTPTAFPDLPSTDEPAFRLLAGRSHVTDAAVRQAYLFARHDAIGLCVALASGDTSEPWSRWADLVAEWKQAIGDAPPPAAILGETRLFVAHLDLPVTDIAMLGDTVSATLKKAGADAWEPPYVTADGACIWWWRDPTGGRHVTILSNPDREAAQSRWLWWRDGREAPDLMLYLLNAAKLDYEARVHTMRRRSIAGSLRDIDKGLDDVLALHARIGASGRTSLPGLVAAQDHLIAAQSASSGVVIELTYLQALRRTIGIARRNLGTLVPAEAADRPAADDSMFKRDQETARWLEEQINQDIGYAEAVVARSKEAQGLTTLRLQQVSTQIARAQGRVTLMQTSLIGAMVASVGASALLHVTVDPADAIRIPLLLCFVSLLLSLPVLAAHWFEPYGPIDKIAAGVLGGAVGWFSLGLLTGQQAWPVIVVAVAIGAVLSQIPIRVHDRRIVPR